jgi:hypothetical protein
LFELQLLASSCWLFAIDFYNKFLTSQHTKSQKTSSESAFSLFSPKAAFPFLKASSTGCLFQLLASSWQKPVKLKQTCTGPK